MKKISLLVIVLCAVFSCNNQKKETDLTKSNLNGKVKSYTISKYNAESRFGKIERGRFNKKYIYKYDDKGNEVEYSKYNLDGSLNYKYIYKYDEKGNQVKENYYKSDGSLAGRSIYKYDEKGNQVEMNFYKLDGSLGGRWIYKYDDKRNPVEESRYNSDGGLDIMNTFKYEFDEKENWTKKIEFNKETPIYITERVFEYF